MKEPQIPGICTALRILGWLGVVAAPLSAIIVGMDTHGTSDAAFVAGLSIFAQCLVWGLLLIAMAEIVYRCHVSAFFLRQIADKLPVQQVALEEVKAGGKAV